MIDRLVDFSAHHRFLTLIFAAVAALIGWQSMTNLPLDALPDVGDRQVIVRSEWDRSPDLVDAQVTHPIVSVLLGTPHVKSVRGISDYGGSTVYVILEDDADVAAARTRVLESLSRVSSKLPEGVKSEIGPDASALGWVFQYVLVDRSGSHSVSDLRSYQDWYLKYQLGAVPGVAEVATVGGLARQYQVNVDPNRLRAYGLSIQRVLEAVRSGNRDVGGRVDESGRTEFVVRGLGYARSVTDLEQILVTSTDDGTPVHVSDVAKVTIGSEFRRGAADFDGTGDAVSGIVIMRQGQNALDVIRGVKARLKQVEGALPAGVEVVTVYDRSELIEQSISSLRRTIVEVMATVIIVIALFLWHAPSAAVPLLTLPLALLIAFIPFRLLGLGANIMSLGGLAIAIGTLVDAAIIVVEQTHKELETWKRQGRADDPSAVILRAIKVVARPSFFALLVIAVAFLPIVSLSGERGRLFGPLAYAKSLAVLVGALLAVTVDPALRLLLTRVTRFEFKPAWLCRAANAIAVGPIHTEEQHPIIRRVISAYEPVVKWSLDHRPAVFATALLLLLSALPMWRSLTTEVMPSIDEGALLYMPSTLPGISIAEAERLLQVSDRTLRAFPEVDRVLGKAGHADTATDPAPLSMFETLIVLKPSNARPHVSTWYSPWAPEWLKPALRRITDDRRSEQALASVFDQALSIPGMANAWTMPIRGRQNMLASGMRTAIGLKVTGSEIGRIEQLSGSVAGLLRSLPRTRSAFAEPLSQGNFLDFRWNREALARAGLTIDDAQSVVQYGIGGEHVTDIFDGHARYPVQVRYLEDFRSDPEAVRHVFVSSADGHRQVPLGDVLEIRKTTGPAMLRNENGLLTGYVYVDIDGNDYAAYVDAANELIHDRIRLPTGYSISWTGEYEASARARQQLMQIVPLTLLVIVLLIYASTRSAPKAFLVMLAVPFSAIGAIWALFVLGYQVSIPVWVGIIALIGVDAETGIFMLLYLDEAWDRAKRENRLDTSSQMRDAIIEGSARRVRPKLMTAMAMFAGLMPVMWSTGAGSEIMKRIAAPMMGGILTSFALELIVYPAAYYWWKGRSLIARPL